MPSTSEKPRNIRRDARDAGAAARSASPRHWSAIAASARPRIEHLRYGSRELGLKRIAGEFGISPQTLRRSLAALRFVERVEERHPLNAISLRVAPVAAIEHLARWHAYDPSGAIKAAQGLRDGEYSVAAIGAAEKAARVKARPERVGRSLVHECRQRVRPVLKEQFEGWELDRPGGRSGHEPSVDFRFRPPGSKKWTIAAVIMGPYKDKSLYEVRLGDWIVRMIGLSMLYERVILILPTAALKGGCAAWLRSNQIDPSRFEMQVIPPRR